MDCETFCGIICPILNLCGLQISPQPCPNNMLPLLIDPPLIIKLTIFCSSLQLILSPYFLQPLFLNNLRNFLPSSWLLLVLLHHEPIQLCSHWKWVEYTQGIMIPIFHVYKGSFLFVKVDWTDLVLHKELLLSKISKIVAFTFSIHRLWSFGLFIHFFCFLLYIL